MTQTELTMLGLLIVIAGQTTYTTYRSWRSDQRTNSRDILVDTSVLMDGRIIPIAESGFIPGRLVIPRSVIGELQLLADKGDTEKRERARRGLDVANQLQSMENIEVTLLQDGSRANEGVDERLLSHARSSGGMLCTIDFNLAKVALVEGIQVLNVNELARGLRMAYLPGDRLTLELTTSGSDSHQAVGHLGDGTMVVVEHAKASIGTSVEVEIIRSLQTAAGKMMFARLANAKAAVSAKPQSTKQSQPPQKRPQQRQQPKRQNVRPPVDKVQNQTAHPDSAQQPRTEAIPSRPQQPKAAQQQRRRPKTSSQREESLIKLVNEQQR